EAKIALVGRVGRGGHLSDQPTAGVVGSHGCVRRRAPAWPVAFASPSRRPVRPRINCHRPSTFRSDLLILATSTAATVVASAIAVAALALLILEYARRRRATLEVRHRDATIDKLTGDTKTLRSMLQEYIQQREVSEEVLRRGEERYRVL